MGQLKSVTWVKIASAPTGYWRLFRLLLDLHAFHGHMDVGIPFGVKASSLLSINTLGYSYVSTAVSNFKIPIEKERMNRP
jgi:hypothetical protein